jgi:hypothetical protein
MMMNFFMPHIQNHNFLFKEWQEFYPDGDLTELNQYVIKTFTK